MNEPRILDCPSVVEIVKEAIKINENVLELKNKYTKSGSFNMEDLPSVMAEHAEAHRRFVGQIQYLEKELDDLVPLNPLEKKKKPELIKELAKMKEYSEGMIIWATSEPKIVYGEEDGK